MHLHCGVFGIATVPRHAVDLGIIADLEETSIARPAHAVVATVPSASDIVAFLPLRHAFADGCDVAD